MESEAALKADKEKAVRRLLDLAQDVKNWDNPSEMEDFMVTEKVFGKNGDNLLHILIDEENPKNEMGRKIRRDQNNPRRERNTSLWADALPESDPRSMPAAAPSPVATASPLISAIAMPATNKNMAFDYVRGKAQQRTVGGRDMIRDMTPNRNPRDRDSSWTVIRSVDKGTDAGIGRNLLIWMLKHRRYRSFFTSLPSAPNGKSPDQEKLPVHLAIQKGNLAFLACFLGLFRDPKTQRLGLLNTILEQEDRFANDGNCVHAAIMQGIPFASCFVAVCSTAALLKPDRDNYTPMHRAMERAKLGRTWVPPRPASFAAQEKPPSWDDTFDPARIFEEILRRSKGEEKSNLMAQILTKVNKDGKSPLQARLGLQQVADKNLLADRLKATIFETVSSISDVSIALYGTSENTKELYLNMTDFNQAGLNFESFVDKLTDQPRLKNDVIAFEDTLFFVHLPDLNYVRQPCPHNTIRKLFTWLRGRGVKTIKNLRIPDNTTTPLSDAFVQKYVFDLFRIESLDWRKLDINLSILSYSTGDAPSANERRKPSALTDLTLYSSGNWSVLYHWMSKDGLAKLPKLRSVRINMIQLDPAPGVYDPATHDRHLELTNAYKTRMDDEFMKASQLEENPLPFIPLIQTDVSWDYPPPPHEPEDTSTQTVKHQFTNQLLPTLNALRTLGPKPVLTADPYANDDLDENSSIKSMNRLGSSRNGDYDDDRYNDRNNDHNDARNGDRNDGRYDERNIGRINDLNDDTRYQRNDHCDDENNSSSRWMREKELFQECALGLSWGGGSSDRRIRVAIIDNGADSIRSRFRDIVAKGQSYVTADELHANQPLPWWTASDPHGTQMASLVSQVNRYCRLYIARVGTLRNDIRADSAARAIQWAIKHEVDVISISWTLRQNDPVLQRAIEEASKNRILIFCSTPDEGMYSEAWPVGYKEHVISVSATDQFGYLTSKARTSNPVDVLIPGENLRASGPSYMGNVSSSVSGSSVATALAAGIASLALVLLQTFNDDTLPIDRLPSESMSDPMPRRHYYYTKKGMLEVFRRMGPEDKAILLSKMFPQDTRGEEATLETLAKLWRVDEWKR